MKSLIRIAKALEQIAMELHTLNAPPKKVEAGNNMKMPSSYSRWTEKETSTLISAHKKGLSIDEMLKSFPGRSWFSVHSKLYKLGLSDKES